MRRYRRLFIVLMLLVSALLWAFSWPTQAQDQAFKNLDACRQGAFSTEEDFMMTEGEAFDGSPYVSDGDILSLTGQVCVRNQELVRPFVGEFGPYDLGLDGLDILSFDPGLIAFSTELDSSSLSFTAGDLLITNGSSLNAIIPNTALTSAFGIGYDIGLDELKFVGEDQNIQAFVVQVSRIRRQDWRAGQLQSLLNRFKIDIWFSIEGTSGNFEKPILDGDLLSAASGKIIATNRDLLDASVPAGIPKDGVDFGLDAFAVPRNALSSERPDILFSTEILYNGRPSFTDGDVLMSNGGGVVATNDMLIRAFHPAARFLGLDALWAGSTQETGPRITHLCDINVGEFNGGTTVVGGSGTGLHESALTSPPALTDTLTQPCGADVPIRGFLTTDPNDPVGNIKKFRVAYREVGTPAPANANDPSIPGVVTSWIVEHPKWVFSPPLGWHYECVADPANPLQTDGNGWMVAKDFMDARYGTGPYLVPGFIRCDNPELRLAVWSTASLPAGVVDANGKPTGEQLPGVWDREDHYVLWLEWEDTGSNFFRENADHHLQLDNTLPIIKDLHLLTPDGKTTIAACGEIPTHVNKLQFWAQFSDLYYSSFRVVIRGGNPPNSVTYTARFYDPDDGTSLIKHTDDTGTMPDGAPVYVRDIDMNHLGASYTQNSKCCYVLDLYVSDRAIRHSFNHRVVNNYTGPVETYAFFTFAASP